MGGNVQGRVFMTHPTKAIYGTLLKDFVKVSRGSQDEVLYKDKDLEASLDRIEVMDFHQTIDLEGIKVRWGRCGVCCVWEALNRLPFDVGRSASRLT